MSNLISQLKRIDSQPNTVWKQSTREFLLSKIRQDKAAGRQNFFERVYAGWNDLVSIKRLAWKPVSIFAIIAFIVLGSSGLTVAVAQKSQPGDSLFLIKRGLEEIQLAVARDNSRKVVLAESILASRFSELNQAVEIKLVSDDNAQEDTVSLALSEVKRQVKVVNTKFNKLKNDKKNDNKKNNQDMIAAAFDINKKMIGYRQELRLVKEKTGQGVSAQINEVLDEVDNINVDALNVIVEKHNTGEADIAQNDIEQSLQNHIGEINSKAEKVLASLDQEEPEDKEEAVKKVALAQEKIEKANIALSENEYSLVLTLASDSNEILKMLYGDITNENVDPVKPEEKSPEEESEESNEQKDINSTSTAKSVQPAALEPPSTEKNIEKDVEVEAQTEQKEEEFDVGIN
ncbi:MAG: hypothetical protein ABIJ91_01690 [Candidatus Kuenenbacteria bacterium]